MLITNLPDIKDREYEILGIVEGSSVFSKHLGKDFMAGIKNLVGGELASYTEMIVDARKLSLKRLEEEAKLIGADAVLNLSYSTTNLQSGAALVVTAIATAIRYK